MPRGLVWSYRYRMGSPPPPIMLVHTFTLRESYTILFPHPGKHQVWVPRFFGTTIYQSGSNSKSWEFGVRKFHCFMNHLHLICFIRIIHSSHLVNASRVLDRSPGPQIPPFVLQSLCNCSFAIFCSHIVVCVLNPGYCSQSFRFDVLVYSSCVSLLCSSNARWIYPKHRLNTPCYDHGH
jgi:hypothetical protein